MFAKHLQIFSIGIQNTFVYRWNFLLRMVCGLVPLAGTFFIWDSVFAARGASIQGYGLQTMVFYFLLAVFVENLISPTEDDWQIAADIRDGRMSSFLVKPMDYLAYRLNLYVSYRLLYIGVIAIPILILAWIMREYLQMPTDPRTWPWFVLSVGMAALIQFFLAYSLAMLAFWILEISTVIFIVYSLEYFLSGHVFPLDLLPPAFTAFVKWSPFTYELYFPLQVYLERIQGAELRDGLCIQAGWVIACYGLARLLWKLGIRRYQAVGG